MATKNTILGTVPKSRGRYTEGDTTTKWYYDNILEYKGSSFRCISEASTGITGAPAIYDANAHTLVPKDGWEFFVDTTGALDVEERLTENKEKLLELERDKVDVRNSDNILDSSTLINGVVLDNSGKELSDDTWANYSTTPPIVVEANTSYVSSTECKFRKVCQYDDNGFISGSIAENVSTFTTLSNCKYVRISFNKNDTSINISKAMLAKGSSAMPFVEYNPIGGYLQNLKKNIEEKVDIKMSENLLNPEWLNKSTLLANNGNVVTDTQYSRYTSTEEYIEVENSRNYSSSIEAKFRKVCQYDADHNHIAEALEENVLTFTTASNCKYVRIMFDENAVDISKAMLAVGNTAKNYEEYNIIGGYLKDINSEIHRLDNSLDKYVQKNEGQNLINIDVVTKSKYILIDGTIADNTLDAFCISDYIPVNGKNIISNALFSDKVSGGNVYDKDKKYIRTLGQTNQYTYTEGDAYVRFGFYGLSREYQANYGNVLSVYDEYNPIGGYIENKVDIKTGINLVDPSKIIKKKYIISSGLIEDNSSETLSVTDYIPVKKQNIIANAVHSTSVSGGNVYDKNKNFIRTLGDTNQYIYQEGDYYVRFGISNSLVIDSLRANYGNVLLDYQPYNPIGGYFQKEAGHNVLWIGTSIPEGCPYPQNACKNLGWSCRNMALGSSGIVWTQGMTDDKGRGDWANNTGRDGKDLSETVAEKEARYRQYVTSGVINEERLNLYKSWSYENRLIPYIDGSIDSCDMVVFDMGINDALFQLDQVLADFDNIDTSISKQDSEFNKHNFVEAFCFLVKKIFEVNPSIKIVVCSYVENLTGSPIYPNDPNKRRGYIVCSLLEKIAKKFGFPYLNMCDYNGFSMEYMPNSQNYLPNYNAKWGTNYQPVNFVGKPNPQDLVTRYQWYCPDCLHPHTDKDGKTEKILTASITKLLRDL